jgi:hypothetical protein
MGHRVKQLTVQFHNGADVRAVSKNTKIPKRKTCTGCGTAKPLTEYYQNRQLVGAQNREAQRISGVKIPATRERDATKTTSGYH